MITGKYYISHRSWLSNFSDEILIITQHSQHEVRNEVHPFHKTNLQKQREIDFVCSSPGVFNLQ
jgi:acyl CoA:acetate/3-ketoacid CoA transferase beta subunit